MAKNMAKNKPSEPNVACALFEKMIEQTPFDDFNVGIVGLHPNAQIVIKRAIVGAAYTGYKYGKGD